MVAGRIDAPTLGILDAHGHGVDLTDCRLYPSAISDCFPALADFIAQARIAPYDVPTRRGELKYLLLSLAEHSGELMLRFVLRSQEPLARIRKHLPALRAALPGLRVVSANLQPEHKAVLEGEREILLTDEAALTMRLNGMPIHLRPQSFFQTNTAIAAALYRQARDWLQQLDAAQLLDLYCGIGGFALHCADGLRSVRGIELSAAAVQLATRAAADNGLTQVQFTQADAQAGLDALPQLPAALIVNPPRRGLGAALCAHLQQSADLRWLLYSSCDVRTLARDLAALPSFHLRRARVFDMFPHTAHFETLCLLERAA